MLLQNLFASGSLSVLKLLAKTTFSIQNKSSASQYNTGSTHGLICCLKRLKLNGGQFETLVFYKSYCK